MRAVLACLMLAGCAAGPAPGSAAAAVPQDVLAVFAHPDDEIVVAPALARALREGRRVTLVYATSGDQGPGVTSLERGAELARRREGEARCAAAALGTQDVRFLGLGDGTLAERPQDASSPARRLAAGLSEILQSTDYGVVLTWGPDGGYGHGDHRIVSAITTQVVQAMGADRPDLLYPGIRAGTLPDIPQMRDWAVTDPALLPIAAPYEGADLARVRKAVDCHQTQFSAEERAQLADLFDRTVWQGATHFRPALGPPRGESPSPRP